MTTGLKQGCLLSTTLFNLYINDLSELLDHSGLWVIVNDKHISHMFYADDLVIFAESAEDLQTQLNALSNWCDLNKMTINVDKTKVTHFRKPSVQRTNFAFMCGNSLIEVVLHILLNQFNSQTNPPKVYYLLI